MKGNVLVALVVGAALGFIGGRFSAPKPQAPARAQVMAPAEPSPAKPAAPRPDGEGQRYKVPVGDSPTLGPATAKVTLIESTDFECPYCSRGHDTVKKIVEVYGDSVRVVVKQNPLGFHKFAHLAAQAALAAGEQGKYFPMHDEMFRNQKALDRASLERYAEALGLDMGRFRQALDTQKFKDRIDAEQRLMVSLGAAGTPSFFINGRKLVGAQPFESFKKIIDEEIALADALLKQGVRPAALYDELVKSGAAPSEAAPAPAPPAPAPDYQKVSVPAHSPFKGPKAAKVTVVEWSDFQCGFCSRGAKVMEEVLAAYPGQVKFVFRHQPLSFHDRATPAAKASMAAHRQGKFFPMHDRMFANQQALTQENFETWAKELGLDLARFKRDMESPEIADQVAKDSAEGNSVGASGTPTFFINGRKVEGAMPFDSFKRIIDEEIKRADALLAKGVKLEQIHEQLAGTAPERPPTLRMEPGSAPMRGSTGARVKLFIFSDFQCGYCARALPVLQQVESTYGNQVAIYFKHFPLGFHDKAPLAAEASMAAHEQGKFWQMHDKIFANQSALDRADFERHASELGLDLKRFKAALDSGKYKKLVAEDMAQGTAAGVTGTPTFVINGKLIVGAQPFPEFQRVIDEALKAR